MIIFLLVLDFCLILYMSICFRTLQMDGAEYPLDQGMSAGPRMSPFYVPAYHCFNIHQVCSIFKSTLMHAQTAEKQYQISQPRTLVPP